MDTLLNGMRRESLMVRKLRLWYIKENIAMSIWFEK